MIPSWLKFSVHVVWGKKKEIGSIEKRDKIELKFSEISWLFIQHFGEQIKFHSEKELRTFSHDPSRYFNILSYLILSYLRSKETKDSANLTKDRSNRHEIRQESTFEGNTDPEKERYTRK